MAGDSEFVTGDIISKAAVVNANKQLAAEGKNLISYTQLLLGITKVQSGATHGYQPHPSRTLLAS